MKLRVKILNDFSYVNDIVKIHMEAFQGFFLTFLGRGFIKQLYKGFIKHEQSNIIGVTEDEKIVGFLAYSENISAFYKYLIKKNIIQFGWYSFLAFLRKPKIMFRLLRAFKYSGNSKSDENYITLSSVGIAIDMQNKGVGTVLIDELKNIADSQKFSYIELDTDAENNEAANNFYLKNGFELNSNFITPEKRSMNKYRYYFLRQD